jgi:diguanylate cyclase (GGDEF)-like protein
MGAQRVGDPLDDTTRTSQAPGTPDDVAQNDAYLVVMAGSNVGEMYKLEKAQLVIGRGDKADLRLVDDGISRDHARIVKDGDRMVLEDLGSTNGTYCNGERVSRQPLSEGDKILLGTTTILKFSYHDKLDEAFQRQMSESALRDGLTRAYNKRYFSERVESELQYSLRHASPLSLIFLDIDHFKAINDTRGHQTGDMVLETLGAILRTRTRQADYVFRWGGDEFLVLLSADEAEAREKAEAIRQAFLESPIVRDLPDGVDLSIGCVIVPPDTETFDPLIDQADREMYRRKRTLSGKLRTSP